MVLSVLVWLSAFLMIYASAYYEANARGPAAMAPAAFLYACMAPAPSLFLATHFILTHDGAAAGAAPLAAAAAAATAATPPSSPSPRRGSQQPSCGAFSQWLAETPPVLPMGAPSCVLVCATAFELLRLGEAMHRFGTSAAAAPQMVGSRRARRRWRRGVCAALSDMTRYLFAALAHGTAAALGVRAAVLLLLPDLALLGEVFGFEREGKVFRFSLRAAMVVVLGTLTWDAGCVAPSLRSEPPLLPAPSAAAAPVFDPATCFYLAAAWAWLGMETVEQSLGLLRITSLRVE